MSTAEVGRHALVLMTEAEDVRESILKELRLAVRNHYIDPELSARRLAGIGAPKTAQLLREHLPITKTARSGDLGEVLATEIAEHFLGYEVPVRRLRYKDGRNMALRGDDIVGLTHLEDGTLAFLKGESKSRQALSANIVDDAGEALDGNRGRPTRHSVLFVAERLWERNEDTLAGELEEAVLRSFRANRIEHLLFTLSGSDPRNLLTRHLKAAEERTRVRYAIGVRISDHGQFVEELFEGF